MCCTIKIRYLFFLPDAAHQFYETRVPCNVAAEDSKFLWK